MGRITTSVLASEAGVNAQSIRFYERLALLPKPARTASGYRVYSTDSVRRVRFIKRAQELGFTLKEIKELLALRIDARSTCADVRRRADEKRRDIEQKIRGLRRITRTLARLSVACGKRRATKSCPILESLDDGDSAA
jgi:MerR family transcriptional regulator, copper efflux regulator